jgi:hypothetical protein
MIVSLTPQIIEDLQTAFSEQENFLKDTVVKEKYKELPEIKYPYVIVEEILNSEVSSRSTTQGERTTLLGYQITCYCRDTEDYDSIDGVKLMLDVVYDTLKLPNYNMQRVGTPAVIPYISDATVMTGALRYNCVYDYETNLIYRS